MNSNQIFMNFSTSVINYLNVENEKEAISRFYDELVSELTVRYSVAHYQVDNALSSLVYNYRHMKNGRTPQECDYNNISSCIGYLHQYAPCHSCMVYAIIHELWRQPLIEIFYLRIKNTLNVTFIGSGPGNDFVGFLSALQGTLGFVLNMNVTFVDKMQGWENIVLATIEKLRNGGCGNAENVYKRINVKVSFLKSDITKIALFDQALQINLKTTEVVFLVKALSTIPDEYKHSALKNIIPHMKPGAILIFIDCPYPHQLSTLNFRLREIYQKMNTKYTCSSRTRFGHKNITRCRADAKVFVKI
ncbi:hypothetical protein HNY73_012624 [Argiope bruennichi]|uniref:Uncharacterized protein n=1 Tax=Argiope bruennichi TaxID=94029 RepID=A0A8T0EVJ2_ARGBR|nr:hypothetical protein HNY73_012624 [Argiope bruennichi]